MSGIFRFLLIAVLVVTSSVPALADRGWRGRGDHDRARDGVRSGRLVPLEAILANIARSYPGYHIDVDGPYEAGGRLVYRIKWLTPDGHVIIIIADAETGQILSTRGGR